jgi:hypothetical protein
VLFRNLLGLSLVLFSIQKQHAAKIVVKAIRPIVAFRRLFLLALLDDFFVFSIVKEGQSME